MAGEAAHGSHVGRAKRAAPMELTGAGHRCRVCMLSYHPPPCTIRSSTSREDVDGACACFSGVSACIIAAKSSSCRPARRALEALCHKQSIVSKAGTP
jgi:hypothetical protein